MGEMGETLAQAGGPRRELNESFSESILAVFPIPSGGVARGLPHGAARPYPAVPSAWAPLDPGSREGAAVTECTPCPAMGSICREGNHGQSRHCAGVVTV